MIDYVRYDKRLIKGKNRVIYKLKGSNKLYIKNNGKMIALSLFKRTGGVDSSNSSRNSRLSLETDSAYSGYSRLSLQTYSRFSSYNSQQSPSWNYSAAENLNLDQYKEQLLGIRRISKQHMNQRLLAKLRKIRNNSLFYNNDHKKLCELQYKIQDENNINRQQYIEEYNIIAPTILTPELTTEQTTELRLNFLNVNRSFLDCLHNNQNYTFINNGIYNKQIRYSQLTKKFINYFENKIDFDILQEYIREQDDFITSLSFREIANLQYYTANGYAWLSSFYLNNWEAFIARHNEFNIYSRGIVIFYHQFNDYFRENNIYNNNVINVDDSRTFVNFLIANYRLFSINIYTWVFSKYMKEIKEIFKKAPKTKAEMTFIRGVKKNYIIESNKLGYYKKNLITSLTIDYNIAEMFAELNQQDKNNLINDIRQRDDMASVHRNKLIQRVENQSKLFYEIIVEKGLPMIFMEGITINKGEYEFILPPHALLYIDHPYEFKNIYTNIDNCPDRTQYINITKLYFVKSIKNV